MDVFIYLSLGLNLPGIIALILLLRFHDHGHKHEPDHVHTGEVYESFVVDTEHKPNVFGHRHEYDHMYNDGKWRCKECNKIKAD